MQPNLTLDLGLRADNTMLTNPRAVPVLKVPLNATNRTIVATIKDGSSVVDLSGAATKLFHARTDMGVAVTTSGAATFVTDGTDGKVQFVLTATELGTARDLYCEFEFTAMANGDDISEMFILRVLERAKA
jgi:hypothetical protein